MPAFVLLAVVGAWLAAQGTVGRLGARLLSWRELRAGETPTAVPTGGATGSSTTPAPAPSREGGTLTIDQIAQVALAAGLDPDQATIATAIAVLESGGQLDAHNPIPPDDSYGLWQINRLAHPQFSPAELVTAEGNARAMLIVSNHGTNWRPWSTYSRALANLTGARAAVQRVKGGR